MRQLPSVDCCRHTDVRLMPFSILGQNLSLVRTILKELCSKNDAKIMLRKSKIQGDSSDSSKRGSKHIVQHKCWCFTSTHLFWDEAAFDLLDAAFDLLDAACDLLDAAFDLLDAALTKFHSFSLFYSFQNSYIVHVSSMFRPDACAEYMIYYTPRKNIRKQTVPKIDPKMQSGRKMPKIRWSSGRLLTNFRMTGSGVCTVNHKC